MQPDKYSSNCLTVPHFFILAPFSVIENMALLASYNNLEASNIFPGYFRYFKLNVNIL
jgi:hypothetical protein